MDFMSTTP